MFEVLFMILIYNEDDLTIDTVSYTPYDVNKWVFTDFHGYTDHHIVHSALTLGILSLQIMSSA